MESSNILIPSFEVEKRTQALSKSIWGFVGLISMFSVGVGVSCLHLMIVSVCGITNTIISENTWPLILAILFFSLIFGAGLFDYVNKLSYSYVITSGKIIKGRITRRDIVGFGAFRLIPYNMNPDFVKEYFYTDVYKKKEYYRPNLVKENKHYYKYVCEDNKTVKIYKIYTGMDCDAEGDACLSIATRVVLRSVLVFLVFEMISAADLLVGLSGNPQSLTSIEQTCSEIEVNMEAFGYSKNSYNEKSYYFEKEVSSERKSTVRFIFDSKGKIKDVKFDLFYNTDSNNVRDELEYIINSATDNFKKSEVSSFIDNVQKTIDGETSFDKLVSDDCTIRLGTSGGHAHIHN